MEKQLFKTLISVMLIICSGFCMHAQITHTVQFSETEYQFETQSDGKTFIRSNNIHSHYGEPGELCLPFTNVAYVIPFGSKAKSVTITPSSKQLIKENLELASNPEEYLTRIGGTQAVENGSNHSKAEKADGTETFITTFWKGVPIANIHICPFSYEDGNLYFVENFTINIQLEDYPLEVRLPEDLNKLETQLKNIVANPEYVNEVIAQLPTVTSASNRKIDYLIITSDELADSFQPLIEWKRKKGLKPFIMTVKDIDTKYFGDDIQEKIKKCIYHLTLEFGLEYVVLGGDDTVIPVRYCQNSNYQYITSQERENVYPTDLYYASFDGNFQWNAQENEYFGTWYDNVGCNIDVNLTRIPVRTAEHVNNYLTKLLSYERGYNSSKWNQSILMTGALFRYNRSKDGRIMSDAESQAEVMYKNFIEPFWDGKRNRFFDTYSDFEGGANYNLTKENLQFELSKSPMFVSMYTHGSHEVWGLKDWHWYELNKDNKEVEMFNYDNLYTKDYAANLVADNYTLITTVACDTNMFDEEASGIDPGKAKDPCLSEAFIRNKDNGVIGYFGSSRPGLYSPTFASLSDTEKFEGLFYKNLFTDPYKHFGELVTYTKSQFMGESKSFQSQSFTVYPFNPIGDAEMPIYTEIPKEFEDICFYLGGSKQLSIETWTSDTQIAVSDNNNPNADPEVSVGFAEVYLPKDATICITKLNYKPLVYQVITDGELLDFYQEIPLKEGYKKKHAAQLYPDQYDILDISENYRSVVLSAVSCSKGTMHVELEGNLLSNVPYTITIQNIMGTETYNYPISSLSEDFNVEEVAKGIYALVLSSNGVEIDSQKICIK